MSQLLQSLLNLQRLDDILLEMRRKKKEIPAQVLAFEKKLGAAKNELDADRKSLQEAQREQRKLEKELEESMEQLRKKQLRKFEVKSNEEYRAILKEIEHSEQKHSMMEDQILRLFEKTESLEKKVRNQETAVETMDATVLAEKHRLELEAAQVTQEHQRAEKERTLLSEGIQKEVLADYEKLRKRRSGLAVVVIRSQICPGCHMAIPFQTINEALQTGEIRHCPSCLRILYCENYEPTEASNGLSKQQLSATRGRNARAEQVAAGSTLEREESPSSKGQDAG